MAIAEQYWSVTAYDRQTHAPTKPLFEKTWVLPDVEKVAAQ